MINFLCQKVVISKKKKENTVKSILKTGKNSEIKKGSSVSSLEKKVLEELRKN